MNIRMRHLVVCLGLLCSATASQAITYTASLSGSAEATPNDSPGLGNAIVDFDPLAHTLNVSVNFSGLLAPTIATHIHCCTAPPGTAQVATQVPTFEGFPNGVTSGTYNRLFNTLLASTWNPDFIDANGGSAAGAEQALAIGLAAGTSYLNIHTTQFPGGEIRGFLTAATNGQVPEPAGIALFAIAVAGLLAARRR